MSSNPQKKGTEKIKNNLIYLLLSQASNLTQQLMLLNRSIKEATQYFPKIKINPEFYKITNLLSQAFMNIQVHVLDQLILEECLKLLGDQKCSKNQYELTIQLIKSLGSIKFVQKVLFSDSAEDLGLAISLNEILSTLEKIVDNYPDIFFDKANEIILNIKNID
jgi:hypothetical protein